MSTPTFELDPSPRRSLRRWRWIFLAPSMVLHCGLRVVDDGDGLSHRDQFLIRSHCVVMAVSCVIGMC